ELDGVRRLDRLVVPPRDERFFAVYCRRFGPSQLYIFTNQRLIAYSHLPSANSLMPFATNAYALCTKICRAHVRSSVTWKSDVCFRCLRASPARRSSDLELDGVRRLDRRVVPPRDERFFAVYCRRFGPSQLYIFTNHRLIAICHLPLANIFTTSASTAYPLSNFFIQVKYFSAICVYQSKGLLSNKE